MRNIPTHQLKPQACGSLACDLCAEDFDLRVDAHDDHRCAEALLLARVNPWEMHDYRRAMARVARAIALQDSVFRE